MNARAPQTFVGINIAHAAEDALVGGNGFDARTLGGEARLKFLRGNLEKEIQSRSRGPMRFVLPAIPTCGRSGEGR